MGYTIETLPEGLNIAHIDENGYKQSIMYKPDPITKLLKPFNSLEELETYAQEKCNEYKLLEPFVENIIEESINIIEEEKPWCDPYDFYLKFTPIERKNILNEKKNDPIVEDFIIQLTMGSLKHIYKDDPVLLMGMNYLVMKSLITEERKNEILNSIGGV